MLGAAETARTGRTFISLLVKLCTQTSGRSPLPKQIIRLWTMQTGDPKTSAKYMCIYFVSEE